jgi:hypothetical protein
VAFKTVDVVIGLALLYLLVTFAASAFVEFLSTARNWRASMLHGAIGNMLENSLILCVNDIYRSPLIWTLSRGHAGKSWVDLLEGFGWQLPGKVTPPSYIPAGTFSGAIIDHLIQEREGSFELSPDGTIEMLQDVLKKIKQREANPDQPHGTDDALRAILETTLATQGNSIPAVRFAIEKWFNDTMDRTSGWYKRRTQYCLLLIGLLIAFGLNIDTIGVVRWLWQGDAARQAAVSAANEYVHANPLAPSATTSAKDSQNEKPQNLDQFATRVVKLDQQIASLQYPIGWPAAQFGRLWFLQYIFGSLITAIAVSMGSTFWFDALQNLLKLRATGPKPGTR